MFHRQTTTEESCRKRIHNVQDIIESVTRGYKSQRFTFPSITSNKVTHINRTAYV